MTFYVAQYPLSSLADIAVRLYSYDLSRGGEMKSLLAIPLLLLALVSPGAFAAAATLISFGSHGCHYDDGSVAPVKDGRCAYKIKQKFWWYGLTKERIELAAPLLIIKGRSGFLACGYINTDTCNDTGEACAVVSGVKTHEEMLEATVESVSLEAMALGVKVGMEGTEAIELFR
jgi:uncharacterized protein YunC (DUF1805 family)